MTVYNVLVFAVVYALAVATPGPGVAAVVSQSLTHGTRGMPSFIAGILIGDLVWFTLAATGLAALAHTFHTAFVVLKYVGVVYLLYLAWRMWNTPAEVVPDGAVKAQQSRTQLFLASLALTLGNPKAMVFFLALLPTVVNLRTLSLPGFLAIAGAIAVMMPLVMGSYALAADRARRLFRNVKAVRLMNRSSGVVMAGAALVVARTN